MRRAAVGAVTILLAACTATGRPSPSPVAVPLPSSPAIPRIPIQTIDDAIAMAHRLATIRGPWDVWLVQKGVLGEIWVGPPPGPNDEERQLFVWRVVLESPTGSQEMYIEATTGRLVYWTRAGS